MSVQYPDNDLTRRIEDAASANRSGLRGGGMASATPLPTVRSASFGQMSDDAPLTPEEIEERNEAARRAGVRDERIGTGDPAVEGYDRYSSFEEAVAAGAPIRKPDDTDARMFKELTGTSRQNAREFLRPSRLPNFKNIQFINLVDGTVVIDGIAFPMDEETLLEFREDAISIARHAVLQQLDEAMSLLFQSEGAEELDGGKPASEVQQHTEGSGEELTF